MIKMRFSVKVRNRIKFGRGDLCRILASRSTRRTIFGAAILKSVPQKLYLHPSWVKFVSFLWQGCTDKTWLSPIGSNFATRPSSQLGMVELNWLSVIEMSVDSTKLPCGILTLEISWTLFELPTLWEFSPLTHWVWSFFRFIRKGQFHVYMYPPCLTKIKVPVTNHLQNLKTLLFSSESHYFHLLDGSNSEGVTSLLDKWVDWVGFEPTVSYMATRNSGSSDMLGSINWSVEIAVGGTILPCYRLLAWSTGVSAYSTLEPTMSCPCSKLDWANGVMSSTIEN